MIQIIEQTFEQKVGMYDKLSKEELIHMLIEANKHLYNKLPIIGSGTVTPVYCVATTTSCHTLKQ